MSNTFQINGPMQEVVPYTGQWAMLKLNLFLALFLAFFFRRASESMTAVLPGQEPNLQATAKINFGKIVQIVFPRETTSHVHEHDETKATDEKCVHKICATYFPMFVLDACGRKKALK